MDLRSLGCNDQEKDWKTSVKNSEKLTKEE